MTEPVETRLESNGLSHHVVTWDGGERGTFVLCHGFLDFAFSFDRLARQLAAAGYRVVAADFRGHGETDWVGAGGYYHFPDYVMDLAGLLPRLARGPVHLVGHSMGGTVCTYYAGVRAAELATLTLVEGFGPPDAAADEAPGRMAAWLSSVAKKRGGGHRPMASHEEALRRMRLTHPTLPEELGLFLAEKATRRVAGGQELEWAFDPLHRTTAPVPFRLDAFLAFARRITVPTLLVFGEKGFRLPDEAARVAHLPRHRTVELPGAGHMVHWEAPDELAALLLEHASPS